MYCDDDTANGGGGPPKHHRARVHPTTNTVSFRFLCPLLRSGGLIGKSGSIVKLLEKETGAKIRVEGSVPRCDERVVNVISADETKTTIALRGEGEGGGEGERGEEVEVEVSAAQHALIRVLERVLEVGEERQQRDEIFQTPGSVKGLLTCRLLADHNQIGHLMGYSGSNLKKIQQHSGGAKIKISADIPACASSNDELILIAGECLTLKKAVLAVSQCLQDSPPVGSKSYKTAPIVPPVEFLPCQSFPPPRANGSVDYTSRSYPMVAEEEVVFRLICPHDRIGPVIGKGGSIVKALEDQTGASISVSAPVAESEDRVIHVSALENAESQYSPAQTALISVFARSLELGNGKRPESSPKKKAMARIIVSKDQIGCLIGKGGARMSEMRRATYTDMWALPLDELPSCVPENDAVVRIIGGVQNVQDALFMVTSTLRDFYFPNKKKRSAGRFATLNHVGPYASGEHSHELGPYAVTDGMHHLRLANHSDHSPSAMQLQSRMMSAENFRGNPSNGRDNLEHASSMYGGTEPPMVRNTTLEILVSVDVLGSAYDDRESNLDRIRQISGASVQASEPTPGTNKLTVFISGTPDQTQAAQMVLQAFIFRT